MKYKNLFRRPAHQDRIIELVKFAAKDPKRVATWVAHKEFGMLPFVVEWWIEPFAHRIGINLYKDGGNQALSNMLNLPDWILGRKFRRKLLLAFQRMMRARTKERFDECR